MIPVATVINSRVHTNTECELESACPNLLCVFFLALFCEQTEEAIIVQVWIMTHHDPS